MDHVRRWASLERRRLRRRCSGECGRLRVELVEHRRWHDRERRRCGHGQEVRRRPAQVDDHLVAIGMQADGVGADLALLVVGGAIDVASRLASGEGDCGSMSRSQLIDDVLRRDRRAVAEGDAGPQLEGDLSAVVGRLPGRPGPAGRCCRRRTRSAPRRPGPARWPCPSHLPCAGSQVSGSPEAIRTSTAPPWPTATFAQPTTTISASARSSAEKAARYTGVG